MEDHDNIMGVDFMITSTKLFVSVVSFSTNDNIKFLENLKQGFKRTIYWNKCRSEVTTQPKNNNLDYMIDPTFKNINRFFVSSSKADENDSARNYFLKYYMPLVEIKGFNALINNKAFFDQPIKNDQKMHEKLVEI